MTGKKIEKIEFEEEAGFLVKDMIESETIILAKKINELIDAFNKKDV